MKAVHNHFDVLFANIKLIWQVGLATGRFADMKVYISCQSFCQGAVSNEMTRGSSSHHGWPLAGTCAGQCAIEANQLFLWSEPSVRNCFTTQFPNHGVWLEYWDLELEFQTKWIFVKRDNVASAYVLRPLNLSLSWLVQSWGDGVWVWWKAIRDRASSESQVNIQTTEVQV
jgi:hypothetical protein